MPNAISSAVVATKQQLTKILANVGAPDSITSLCNASLFGLGDIGIQCNRHLDSTYQVSVRLTQLLQQKTIRCGYKSFHEVYLMVERGAEQQKL